MLLLLVLFFLALFVLCLWAGGPPGGPFDNGGHGASLRP